MSLPGWANAETSAKLPDLRAQGEGQNLEFKEQFPEQAQRLAKAAAFATSGGGTILIGVDRNGIVVGLRAKTEEERDDLIHRAQSIVRNFRPPVKHSIDLGWDGELILVVEIAKQDEPVFYYEYRPYVREGREARPAEPDEVKDLVWAHPSSEHKRKMEELSYERKRAYAEDSRERYECGSLRRGHSGGRTDASLTEVPQ